MKYLLLLAISAIIFIFMDLLWLGVIAKSFYRARLGFILSDKVNWAAAVIFYFIYCAGVLWFAVLPSLENGEWHTALINGCLLGLLCYATYDLTNMATIAKWPLQITLIDIAWGAFITGTVSVSTHLVAVNLLGFGKN